LRGLKANIGGRLVEAVAIYTGGRTGPHAVAGSEVMEMVPCDASLPDVVARVINGQYVPPMHPDASLPGRAVAASGVAGRTEKNEMAGAD
jgi:hypothetical protein